MTENRRHYRWALCLVVLCAFGFPSLRPAEARPVTVRFFKGTQWGNPKDTANNLSFQSRTVSSSEDREAMGNPNENGTEAHRIISEQEQLAGYLLSDLAPPARTGLDFYFTENRPTAICFCTGNVLLMAMEKHRLNQGAYVPPLAAGGNAFYGIAQQWGTTNERPVPGNLVFFFKEGAKTPEHVAIIISDDWVTTKDMNERVYEMSLSRVEACEKYARHEIWGIPWNELSVEAWAGTNDIFNHRLTPQPVWVGDTPKVSFDFKITNTPNPKAQMVVEVKATLLNAAGQTCDVSGPKEVSPTRTGERDAAFLKGNAEYEHQITEAGKYQWILEVSSKQLAGDEGIAIYGPCTKIVDFEVLPKPMIVFEKFSVDPAVVPEGGTVTLNVKYKLTGMPSLTAGQLTRVIKQTWYDRPIEGGAPQLKTESHSPPPWNVSGDSGFGFDRSPTFRVGAEGPASVKLTVRLEVPGHAPVEEIREAEYTVEREQ